MTEEERKQIFLAHTDNLKELKTAWKIVNRSINSALVKNDHITADIHTKTLALIYCCIVEASFSKNILTPHAFNILEIFQIKRASKNNLLAGWKKALELALRKINAQKSNHIPNVSRKIYELIDTYVLEPSVIRNKLAHGQWHTALNRKNNALNSDLTSQINGLNVIDLVKHQKAFEKLNQIFEDIIESPNKAHMRDYWDHINELEQEQIKMNSWTIQRKVNSLKRKARPPHR